MPRYKNPALTNPAQIKRLQTKLKNLGLYSGKIDGIYGPLTEKSHIDYNNHASFTNIGSTFSSPIGTSFRKVSQYLGLPLNARQFIADQLGSESTLDETDLTKEEFNALQNIVRKNLTAGKKTISYEDYATGSDIGGTKMNTSTFFNKLADPYWNLKTTLGQASINVNNGDTTVTDQYNFNDQGIVTPIEALQRFVDRPDPYSLMRSLGTIRGSGVGRGSKINIKTNEPKPTKVTWTPPRHVWGSGGRIDIVKESTPRLYQEGGESRYVQPKNILNPKAPKQYPVYKQPRDPNAFYRNASPGSINEDYTIESFLLPSPALKGAGQLYKGTKAGLKRLAKEGLEDEAKLASEYATKVQSRANIAAKRDGRLLNKQRVLGQADFEDLTNDARHFYSEHGIELPPAEFDAIKHLNPHVNKAAARQALKAADAGDDVFGGLHGKATLRDARRAGLSDDEINQMRAGRLKPYTNPARPIVGFYGSNRHGGRVSYGDGGRSIPNPGFDTGVQKSDATNTAAQQAVQNTVAAKQFQSDLRNHRITEEQFKSKHGISREQYRNRPSNFDVAMNQVWEGAKEPFKFIGADPDLIRTNPAEGIPQALAGTLMLELPVGEMYQASKQGISRLKKALGTESGLLSNTYKVNPWAFKPNPEAYYRGIGKKGMEDIFQSGVIKSKKQHAYPEPYFSKGVIGDKYAKGYFAELTGEPMKGVGSFPEGSLIQTPVNTVNINNPNLKLYQKDWLRGYKEVSKPKSSLKAVSKLGSKDGMFQAGKAGLRAAESTTVKPFLNFTKESLDDAKGFLKRRQFIKQLQNERLIGKEFNIDDLNYAARSTDKTNKLTQLALNRNATRYRGVQGEVPAGGIGYNPDTGGKFNMSRPAWGNEISEFENMAKAGVDFNDPISIAKYQATHVPMQQYGYRSGIGDYKHIDALYTSFSPTNYGNYQIRMTVPRDYSKGNYQDWFDRYYNPNNNLQSIGLQKGYTSRDFIPDVSYENPMTLSKLNPSVVGRKGQKMFDVDENFPFINYKNLTPTEQAKFEAYKRKLSQDFNTGWRGQYQQGGKVKQNINNPEYITVLAESFKGNNKQYGGLNDHLSVYPMGMQEGGEVEPTRQDSLDLYNFYNLQRQLDLGSDITTSAFNLFSTPERYEQYTSAGKARQKVLHDEAEKLLQRNPNLRKGLYTERASDSNDYYTNGSYDLYHPRIKPKGIYWGSAVNEDYSNVKPAPFVTSNSNMDEKGIIRSQKTNNILMSRANIYKKPIRPVKYKPVSTEATQDTVFVPSNEPKVSATSPNDTILELGRSTVGKDGKRLYRKGTQDISEQEFNQLLQTYPKSRVKEYGFGGKLFKSIGDGLQNSGAFLADNALSIAGATEAANNLYTDSRFGKAAQNVSKITNQINKVAGTIGATALGGPAAGMAMGQVQNMTGNINRKPNQEYNDWDVAGQYAGSLSSMAGMFYNPAGATSSVNPKAKYGGSIRRKIAKQGGTIRPTKGGMFINEGFGVEHALGNLHEDGGIVYNDRTEVENNEKILDGNYVLTDQPYSEPYMKESISRRFDKNSKAISDRNNPDITESAMSFLKDEAIAKNEEYLESLDNMTGKYKKGGLINRRRALDFMYRKMHKQGGVLSNLGTQEGRVVTNRGMYGPGGGITDKLNQEEALKMAQLKQSLLQNPTNPVSQRQYYIDPVQEAYDPTWMGAVYNTARTAVQRANDISNDPNYAGYGQGSKGIPYRYPSPKPQTQKQFPWEDALYGAASLAPALYNMGAGLFGKTQQYNPENYITRGRLSYKPISGEETKRQINSQRAATDYQLRDAGITSRRSRLNNSYNAMQTMAQAQEIIDNINTQGQLETDKYNIGLDQDNNRIRLTVADINDRNRAARQNMLAQGFSDISEFAQGTRRDKIMKSMLTKMYGRRGGRIAW